MNLSKRADADRFLASPTLGVRAALIHGRDRGGVRERATLLAGKVTRTPDDPFDTTQLSEADVADDPARLPDELSAFSMMGGRRLIRLRLTGEKPAPEKIAAEALKAHVEGAFNPDAFLLIECGALKPASALRKAAETAKAAVSIAVYEDETGDVARLIRERLAADGLALTQPALELLATRLPKERGVARQEIERLALFLGPGSRITATPDDLTDFLGVEPEVSLSDAALDAFGARAAEAQAGLRRAWSEGEGGPAAVRALSQHLARLRRVATLVEAGAGAQEAAKSSGVFWKAEREFLRQHKAWRLPELDRLQPDVLEADRACKQAGAPDILLTERLALTIAARARRLGL